MNPKPKAKPYCVEIKETAQDVVAEALAQYGNKDEVEAIHDLASKSTLWQRLSKPSKAA